MGDNMEINGIVSGDLRRVHGKTWWLSLTQKDGSEVSFWFHGDIIALTENGDLPGAAQIVGLKEALKIAEAAREENRKAKSSLIKPEWFAAKAEEDRNLANTIRAKITELEGE